MRHIYLVMGTNGEYSDRQEWPVIAYTSELLAQEHVLNAEKEAKRIGELLKKRGYYAATPKGLYSENLINAYDSNMTMDYDLGTSYFYYESNLVE